MQSMDSINNLPSSNMGKNMRKIVLIGTVAKRNASNENLLICNVIH